METIVTVTHLFVSLALIALILVQHGKGADAGAAFGSGASGTVFGANGAANFLSRSTAFLATSFFVLSLALGWFAINTTKAPDLIIDDNTPAPIVEQQKTEPSIPEVPVVPPSIEEKTDKAAALPAIPE